MASLGLLAVWLILSGVGIALVYYVSTCIERWSHALGFVCLVSLGPAALIGGGIAAHHIVRLDVASCEERDPDLDRLSGMSPSEFRARCMATRDSGDWLTLRKS